MSEQSSDSFVGVKPDWVWCDACGKKSDLNICPVTRPNTPNTLTELPDINQAMWQCVHCGAWWR
jgi:hypothetical protein